MRRLAKHIGLLLMLSGLLLVAAPLYRWGTGIYYQRLTLSTLEEQAEVDDKITPPLDTNQEQSKDELPSALGLLEIPKIDLKAAVMHGVAEEDLKKGPGFYPQSKHPEVGNVSIAAHRGVYGSWFRHLDRLEAGDTISLTLGTNCYQYQVREQFVTHSRDWSVVESTEQAELTLTTCLFTTTTKRLIVKADLVKVTEVKTRPKARPN